MAKPSMFEGWPKTFSLPPFGAYAGVVDRVVDGDSFYAWVRGPFDHYPYLEFRLYRASSPEKNTPEGKAAKAFAEKLMPSGSRVILNAQRADFSRTFTRYVAAVLLEDGRDLASEMVNAGHARWGEFEG